jgi:hypothetical protein
MIKHKEGNKKIIAIDFDGTIVEHDFPRTGKLMPKAKSTINYLHKQGHRIIIWTCRNNSEPSHQDWDQAPVGKVMEFLDENGIRYDCVNENHPDMGFWLESRKIFTDVYIDDKNLGGFPGWDKVPIMLATYHNFNFTFKGGATTYPVRPDDAIKPDLAYKA